MKAPPLTHLNPKPTPTSQEIDRWILEKIQKEKEHSPNERITNLGLSFALIHHYRDRLPHTSKFPQNDLQNAQELVNRSCQRLRKAGKISWDKTNQWQPNP